MHHKRRSRRRDKRIMLSCGCCSREPNGAKVPIEDGPCTGKQRKKKPTPKKDKCPTNRTHEWYKEWEVKTELTHFFGRTYTYTVRKYKATCIHCWKEKILKCIVKYA